jgi:hypothetical protein
MEAAQKRKAPRGYTYDACPGCKVVNQERPRPKDEVCGSCKAILDAHARQAAEVREMDLVRTGVPTRSHWLPYIPEDTNELCTLFLDVVRAVSKPSTMTEPLLDEHRQLVLPTNSGSSYNVWYPSDQEDYRVMPRAVALALRALYGGVLTAPGKAYAKGKSDGSNLLAMLNSGDLTNKDFEQRAGITRRD